MSEVHMMLYLYAWHSPCSLHTAASEQEEKSDMPLLHARHCPQYDCLKRLHPPQAAQPVQMLPNYSKYRINKAYWTSIRYTVHGTVYDVFIHVKYNLDLFKR